MIFNIISNREWEYGQVTVTIKGATATSTYDAANHSASGYTVTISDPNYKTTDFSFTGTASATGKNAGTYYMGMTSAQFVNNNPRFRNVVFSVTDGYVSISRKAVTVKADNKSKTYGQSDPALTATVTGTLGSDTVTYSLSRVSGSNVGSYTITATGNATQGNYSVTYQTGTLTINKAAAAALGLSVSGGTYTYNGTGRSISASVTVTTGTTIQYSTDNTNWSNTNPSYTNVGTYKVYARAVNSNYNTATGNANVVINKAAASALGLSITGYNRAYDANSHSITATTTVTTGTTIQYRTSTTAAWSNTKPTRTAVGTTTVYVQAVNSNYETATGNTTIVVTAKAVTVKADNKSKTYGQSDPTLTATVTGTLGSDTVTYTISRAAGENYKSDGYVITPSGNATQGNYSVTYQTGTFTINKAAASALGLTVTNYSGYYDGNGHSITARTTVTSGTTIQYRTSTTAAWSNTNPSISAVGETTVYVRAVNNNYNTASATGKVTLSGDRLYIFKQGVGLSGTVTSSDNVSVTTSSIQTTKNYGTPKLYISAIPYVVNKTYTKVKLEYSAVGPTDGSQTDFTITMGLMNTPGTYDPKAIAWTTESWNKNSVPSSKTVEVPITYFSGVSSFDSGVLTAAIDAMQGYQCQITIKNWWLE